MNRLMLLQQALLDLGLEDLIPLPEIVSTEEVRAIGLGLDETEELATALIGLLRAGRIQVWRGHSSQEPEIVQAADAEVLLGVRQQYEFNSAADLEQRIYYVNVDNLRVDEQ